MAKSKSVSVPQGHVLVGYVGADAFTSTQSSNGRTLYWQWCAGQRTPIARAKLAELSGEQLVSAPPVKPMPKAVKAKFEKANKNRKRTQKQRHYDGVCGCRSGDWARCAAVKKGYVTRSSFGKNAK